MTKQKDRKIHYIDVGNMSMKEAERILLKINPNYKPFPDYIFYTMISFAGVLYMIEKYITIYGFPL